MKKLPIGLQTFRKLIEDDYVYVDKTRHILELIRSGTYFFLSRPRRFGKSLLISTLKEIFSGQRELFKGLYIEDRIRAPDVGRTEFRQLRSRPSRPAAAVVSDRLLDHQSGQRRAARRTRKMTQNFPDVKPFLCNAAGSRRLLTHGILLELCRQFPQLFGE